MQEPEIILADEPIASLDPRNTRIVMDALQRINRHYGITVLCNLHSLDLARAYCDRLVGMAAGRVVFDGAAARAHRRRGSRTLRHGGRGRAGPGRARPRPAGAGALPACLNITVNPRRPYADPPHVLAALAAARALRHRPPAPTIGRPSIPSSSSPSIPEENASGVDRPLRAFMTYLTKELGIKVTLRVANDYAAVIEGQRAGNIQIAYYGPASFARALVTGVKTDAFAIDVNSDGTRAITRSSTSWRTRPTRRSRISRARSSAWSIRTRPPATTCRVSC